MFERYGIPLKTMEFRLVNGRVYTRLLPLVAPEKESKQPPAPVLWTLTRVLPVFRRAIGTLAARSSSGSGETSCDLADRATDTLARCESCVAGRADR